MGLNDGKTTLWLLLICSAQIVKAEDTCFGAGSIVISVALSVFVTLFIIGLIYYWIKRKPHSEHLILETDPEKGKAEYAFDNPGFKDAGLSPSSKSWEKTTPKFEAERAGKQKWNHWPGLSSLTTKSEKRRTMDDTMVPGNEVKVVALRSHDFTGLGFNICGNMKEGIFIKDILHRGPASESGKLNAGDRINSVTISFEHIVYEDALTILSYASPYEVMIEAKGGKAQIGSSTKSNHPSHPIYRSSSSTDLHQVEKSARKKLYSENSLSSNYSTLHKSMSNMTTLERKNSNSPKPKSSRTSQNSLNHEQLKNQLEQKISSAETEARLKKEPVKIEIETQKTENKHQKFGIKVFPSGQQKSPKTAELSQNDNNINIEKNKTFTGLDEVDATIKVDHEKHRKNTENDLEKTEAFTRNDSLHGSGLKRDSNGIPQEIPSHMLNAAVAARRNRKSPDEMINEDDMKTPKKTKGKAPLPPPEEKSKENGNHPVNDIYEIKQVEENTVEIKTSPVGNMNLQEKDNSPNKESLKDYNSDSDVETDNQSSVNTIELNSSDITIHHEENDDKQNRKTASTGDLSKIHKTRKSSTGTLERAQSLDITDTGMPSLSKKRKGANIEDTFDMKSDEDLYGNAMKNKEPRLSLILDGLNTFQRNKLKKSTEWGNLEDAILKSSQDDDSITSAFDQSVSVENMNLNFVEMNALVNKIDEIRRESQDIDTISVEAPVRIEKDEMKQDTQVPKNVIWPNEIGTPVQIEIVPPVKIRSKAPEIPVVSSKPKAAIQNEIWPKELEMNDGEKVLRIEEMHHNITNDKEKEPRVEQMVNNVQPQVVDNIEKQKDSTVQEKAVNDSYKVEDDEDKRKDNGRNNITILNGESSQHRIPEIQNIPLTTEEVTKTSLVNDFIGAETPPQDMFEKQEMQTDLDEYTENAKFDSIPTESNIKRIDIVPPNRTRMPSENKVQKRQQIPNGVTEILPPPGMGESNLEQEIFDELRRNYSSVDIYDTETVLPNSKTYSSNTNSIILTPDRFNGSHSGMKQDSETGEICPQINNTDEIKTSGLSELTPPRYSNDTISFITNESFVCAQDGRYQTSPDDINISDDIKVSRHSLGSLERPKSDDAKSIESSKYLSNISNVTINSVQTENGSSSLHSLEFSVNEPNEESRMSDNSELYTTALNRTLKQERDSKITISTPDLIKNVTITEAINTLNSDMDQSLENEIIDGKHHAKTPPMNGADSKISKSDNSTTKNHSSLTYITEIQVTPNNGPGNVSEVEIVPSLTVDSKQSPRDLDNEFEDYVRNFDVKKSQVEAEVAMNKDEPKIENEFSVKTKIDPEKELHKIQEIAQEQLKKLPEMRFSTSSYETPSRIPEKRQSQIELLKSNFEKTSPKTPKVEIPTKSRIPISTTLKTPPTSPERRDSRNLDMENEREILELMSSTVHSTPMTNSLKYQKSPNKNVTITSIRNNSKIPSGLPVLGGSRPPIPRKPDHENDTIVQVSTNNINNFKQWVFEPVDSVTNISLSGNKSDHK